MLSVILNDVLIFASTPDLAAMLLASRRFSAVADGVVARRTVRTVRIRQCAGEIHVTAVYGTPSGATSFQAVQLSESDDVEQKLRPLLLGGIIELFVLPTDALADQYQRFDWFVDVLSSLVTGGIVSPAAKQGRLGGLDLCGGRALPKVEVHYDDARDLRLEKVVLVDHGAHRAKCDALGIREVQFFEKKIGVNLPQVSKLNVPRAMPLGIQRIIGLLEAPATVGYAVPAEKAGRWTMDNLFAAYRKEFGEDIKEPEKLCNVLALREDDARRILERCPKERPLSHAHFSTFKAIFENAAPSVFEVRKPYVCLRKGYEDKLAKWKHGSPA